MWKNDKTIKMIKTYPSASASAAKENGRESRPGKASRDGSGAGDTQREDRTPRSPRGTQGRVPTREEGAPGAVTCRTIIIVRNKYTAAVTGDSELPSGSGTWNSACFSW